MKKSMIGKVQHSITRKIFTVVFPIYLLISIFLTCLILFFYYNNIRLNLKSEILNLENILKPGLIRSLQNQNIYEVDRLLRLAQKNDAILGVRLEAPFSDRTFLKVGQVDPILISGAIVQASNLQNQEQDGTIYELGTLKLYSGNQAIIEKGLMGFICIVFFPIVLVIFLWFLFLWGADRYLSNPLSRLISMIQKISTGELQPAQAQIAQESREGTDVDVLILSFNTMMERLARSSQDLVVARNRLDGIIRAMPSALIGITQNGVITDWNLEAETISGITSTVALGKPIGQVFEKIRPYLDKIDKAISERSVQEDRKIKQGEGEQESYYDLMIYPVVNQQYSGAVIRIDDITQKVKMEEVMVQTEKMTSVGGLAAGVAHEINNPLGAIIQGTQNILRRTDPNLPGNIEAAQKLEIDLEKIQAYLQVRKIFEFIEGIKKSGERAADIVSNLLQFSRRSTMERVQVSFEEIVDRALELAKTDYSLKHKIDFKNIEILKEYQPNLPPIFCAITEVEQVVLNLLKNAFQAMQDNTQPPKIILRLAKQQEGVCLEVCDNGTGMPQEVRKRIFEPFFTTKPVGEGTGLGLSVSYNLIVQNNKGKMSVESTEGQGSKFIVILPIQS